MLAAVVLTLLKIPRPPVSHSLIDGRPLIEIVRQPKFIVAVVCGLASYAMMNMVMTSAPLAMVMCNHSVSEAALGIQWHVHRHVRAELHHRLADRSLRRAAR